MDLNKLKGVMTQKGYFIKIDELSVEEEKFVIETNNITTPGLKLRICFNCGKTWHQRSENKPRTCPNRNCHSTYWDVPKLDRPHFKLKDIEQSVVTGGLWDEPTKTTDTEIPVVHETKIEDNSVVINPSIDDDFKM